ncbi:Cell wall integrity and stress response component 4 [Madurella fahalii]|uniref:Cell wall integrity and stress response component 4 n=1 Tax=Madurella fahalii TaxID=1157608 RepID=A0ABQ0GFR0_9PEZI
MAVHRTALLWASFTFAVIMHGMVKGQQGPSIPMAYCATVNTAEMTPFTSIYQSDGRCFGNCSDRSYPLAIVHEMRCWCSSLIPNSADRRPLEECQYPCPGFPSDFCGGDGVFGYMEIGEFQPSGTAPPGFGLSSTEAPPSTSAGNGPPPIIQTVTVGGTVRTVTATPNPTDGSNPALVGAENPGLQTGAIVGIVIGVIGGVAVLAAFIWFFLMKRRKQSTEEGTGYVSPTRGGSSPGMMATPTTGEISGGGIVGAADPQPPQAWDSRRRSHLMPVDPRLDPFATGIYAGGPNKSRESFNSLQDNQDYSRRVHEPSRVLRAMNPDPDED